MKLYFYMVFIFFISFIYPMSSEDLEEVHGEFLKCGLSHYSPMQGIVGESPLFKNMWQHLDDEMGVGKLLHTLFYMAPGGECDPSKYRPFNNFTGATVACLVHAVDQKLFGKTEELAKIDERVRDSFSGKKNRSDLQGLYDALAESQAQEDESEFPKFTTAKILLGFLVKKAKQRQELFDYQHKFMALRQKQTEDDTSMLRYLEIKKTAVLYPPRVEWATNLPTIKCNSAEVRIQKCNSTEVSIQSLLNELLFDPDTKKFDLSRLPGSILKVLYAPVREFYERFPQADSFNAINQREIKLAWVNITSNLPNVVYCEEHKGILSLIQNFCRVFSLFTGVEYDASGNPTEFLRQFCQRLSESKFFEIKFIHLKPAGSETLLTFTLKDKQGKRKPYSITLHLLPEHTYFEREPDTIDYDKLGRMRKGVINRSEEMRKAIEIEERLCNNPEDHEAISLCALYAPFIKFDAMEPYLQNMVLFSLPTQTDEQRYLVILKAIQCWKKSGNQHTRNYVLSLLRSITNRYYLEACFVRLIRCKFYTDLAIKSLILEKSKELWNFNQQSVLLALARNKGWQDVEYRNLMLEILDCVPEKDGPDAHGLKKYGFIKDNKLWILMQLHLSGCTQDPLIKEKVNDILANFSDKRKTRYDRLKNLLLDYCSTNS